MAPYSGVSPAMAKLQTLPLSSNLQSSVDRIRSISVALLRSIASCRRDPATPTRTVLTTIASGPAFAGENEIVAWRPSGGPNISIVTNDEIRLRNAGALTNIGTGAAIGVQDVIYAERFAGSTVRTLIEGGAVPTTGLFRTGVFDASTVGVFESAGLYYGTVNADGTASIDLSKAIYKENEFVGQDGDLTPLFFNVAPLLAKKIEKRLADDPTLDLFLVLAAKNNPNLGDSGLPPLLGLSAAAPTGNSFLSVAGGPFAPRPNNWIVELRFTDQASSVERASIGRSLP